MQKKSSMLLALTLTALISAQTFAQIDSASPAAADKAVAADVLTSETIKYHVTQYFEWLYAAAKEGDIAARSLRPMSSLPESQNFLGAKNDALEVAEYSNQLNGVKIVDQSFELDFRRVSLNIRGARVADVEVVERYHRTYEFAPESATGEITHRIRLQNQRGRWEVTADTLLNANDAPPQAINKAALMEQIRRAAEARRAAEQQLLFDAGVTPTFLAQERERLSKQGLNARVVEQRLAEIVNAKMRGEAQPSAGPGQDTVTVMMNANRGYDRSAAKAYIDRWWNNPTPPGWGSFYNLGGDCTNWMSQIINAGGVPEDKTGSYQWYWDNMSPPRTSPPYTRSSSWSGVNELWAYIQGNSLNNGPYGPQGRWWTDNSGRTQMETGDVIQLYNGSKWFHTYGVYDAQWVNLKPWYCPWCADNWQYKIRVTSHDSNRRWDDLDSAASGYPTRRYVHITGWYQP